MGFLLMSKVKFRSFAILSFFVLFALCLGLGFGLLSPRTRASADEKTYSPSSLFWSRTGGEVKAYKANSDAAAYVTFEFSDGGSVEYHRDLALKWYEAAEESTSELANPGAATYFSMTFAFGQLNFESYTVSFSSAEENITKDGQAVNRIVFANTGAGVEAYVKNSADEESAHLTVDPAADIAVTFSKEGAEGACEEDEFAVRIGGEYFGTFDNVGGNFMEYRTSGTTNIPVTFEAKLTEAAKSQNRTQKVFMKSLNGQTLEVTGGTDGAASTAEGDTSVEYVDGRVTDNHPAALVMSEKVYAFTLGQRFNLDYEAIDVCNDSPTPRRTFYMLKKNEDGSWHKPSETTDDDYTTLSTNSYFMPPNDGNDAEEEYVSIRVTLNDGRDGALQEYIYLTWYADLDADVVRTLGEGENRFDYILVNRERKGPSYTVVTAKDADPDVENDEGSNVFEDPNDYVGEYQKKLEELAKDTGCGSGAYFYLPSLRNLISSDYADYRNLRFNIYVKKPVSGTSASSESSLRYNNLRFQVDTEGQYVFRVAASDAAGNSMMYYVDGELVAVTNENIWDIEEIPEFKIWIGYRGATIEPAGEQSIGYRGSTYNISQFEIVEGSGCKKEYELFFIDQSKLQPGQSLPSYSDLVENADTYFGEGGAYASCLKAIREYNPDITSDDDRWADTDNDYSWNPDSSLSFVPQSSGYYVVRLDHTDPNYHAGASQSAYQVIEIRNPIDFIPGETNWFRNNVTSVILFSISAVLAVIIIILFVVKPSDKKVEEVDLGKLKGRKSVKAEAAPEKQKGKKSKKREEDPEEPEEK